MDIDQIITFLKELSAEVVIRFLELLRAPIDNSDILWSAIPLLIATLFIMIYFGKHQKEELGWGTAFGNTMVFLFVAIEIIKKMYYHGGNGSIENIIQNGVYLPLTIGLITTSIGLMTLTYFQILPKRLAFFLFSAPPINVTVYVLMTMVYANVKADHITILASILFLAIILVIKKIIEFAEDFFGWSDDSVKADPNLVDEIEESQKSEREKILEKIETP